MCHDRTPALSGLKQESCRPNRKLLPLRAWHCHDRECCWHPFVPVARRYAVSLGEVCGVLELSHEGGVAG